MKRLNISVEQKEALDRWTAVKEDYSHFVANAGTFQDLYEPLNSLTHQEFALLLAGWYEVEKSNPFEVGDWGYSKLSDTYFKVRSSGYNIETTNGSYSPSYIKEYLAKVEEPWKIALLENGRENPEFKEGDKITSVHDDNYTISHPSGSTVENIESGSLVVKYIYPVESRIEVSS